MENKDIVYAAYAKLVATGDREQSRDELTRLLANNPKKFSEVEAITDVYIAKEMHYLVYHDGI